jgi:hypothetical protein
MSGETGIEGEKGPVGMSGIDGPQGSLYFKFKFNNKKKNFLTGRSSRKYRRKRTLWKERANW